MTILRIAAIAALASGAFAATHIHDACSPPTFTGTCLNDGVTPMAGTIRVTGPNGGATPPSTQTVTIGTGGVVDFNLIGCPGCAYVAQYNLVGSRGERAAQFQEVWIVANTISTLTVKQLWGGSSAPYYLISKDQINPAGLLPGQLHIWDGNSWVPGYPSSSADAASIHGTSVPANSAADQVLITTAPAVSGWVSIGDCVAAGRVLRYSTSTHSYSCPALGSGDIPDLSLVYEPKDATILRTANFGGSGSAATVAHSDHNHTGTYEPVDVTILRQASLLGSGVSLRPARSDHTHAGVYETASTNGGALAAGTYCMTVDGSGVKTWGTCPAGGGGGGGILSWATLTNPEWASMSNAQWTTMTN